MRILYTILFFIIVTAGSSIFISSANKTPSPTPIAFVVPKGWPQPVYDFSANPVTEEGFQLGRRLFYDGRLSRDGNFSCAACHQQFAAFATYDHNLSHGVNNNFTRRNAPGLFNLAWQKEFMWDGGITHLDLQPLAPMTDTLEMGETIDNILTKLRADTAYRRMFNAAFGSTDITTQRLTRALSQFVLMMVSANSKYDRVMRGEDTFDLPQRLGYEIFMKKCQVCHTPPLFTDYSYRNTGITADQYLNDIGRMKITRNPVDSLKFKVPSLRNVQLTFPYGHDGRFFNLQDVLDHYRKAVTNSPTVDSLVRNNLNLSNYETGQLKAFMYALTDSSFLHDARFAPPGYENRTPKAPSEHEHLYKY